MTFFDSPSLAIVTLDRPVLIVDNYDSFTYNLVQYLGELGVGSEVVRNDCIDFDKLEKSPPAGIVISPGPGQPYKDTADCDKVLDKWVERVPILGVCLGYQLIAAWAGARVYEAQKVAHGEPWTITHNSKSKIFSDISESFVATRYHSLIVDSETLPSHICETAWIDTKNLDAARQTQVVQPNGEGFLMAIEHTELPCYGVQFHPESILTNVGRKILQNFLLICQSPP